MMDLKDSNASELVDKAKDTTQQWASSVGGAAVHAAVQAQDKAMGFTSAAVNNAEDIAQDLTALIRRHPLQSVLVGLGVGIGVGLFLAQMMRRS
jgi:ElaB/YqjD/DUF883 family membrane-anchored ribosome-binding protein